MIDERLVLLSESVNHADIGRREKRGCQFLCRLTDEMIRACERGFAGNIVQRGVMTLAAYLARFCSTDNRLTDAVRGICDKDSSPARTADVLDKSSSNMPCIALGNVRHRE